MLDRLSLQRVKRADGAENKAGLNGFAGHAKLIESSSQEEGKFPSFKLWALGGDREESSHLDWLMMKTGVFALGLSSNLDNRFVKGWKLQRQSDTIHP